MDTKSRLNNVLDKAEDAANKGQVRVMEGYLHRVDGYAERVGEAIKEREASIIQRGYSTAIHLIFRKAESFDSKNAPSLRDQCLDRVERYVRVVESSVNSGNPDEVLQQYAGMDRAQISKKIAGMRG